MSILALIQSGVPALDEGQATQAVDTIKQTPALTGSEVDIASLYDEVEGLNVLVEDLNTQLASQGTLIWILFGCLAVAIAVLVVLYVKLKKSTDFLGHDYAAWRNSVDIKLERQGTTPNTAMQRLEQRMSELADDVTNVKRQLAANDAAVYRSAPTVNLAKGTSTPPAQKPRQPETPQTVKKYFMLQADGSTLLVRNRNLRDDSSAGWFVMTIDGDKARYDINRNAVGAMLSDIATLQICVEPFASVSNPRDIVTVQPGTMVRNGQDWVVTRKLTVKLA